MAAMHAMVLSGKPVELIAIGEGPLAKELQAANTAGPWRAGSGSPGLATASPLLSGSQPPMCSVLPAWRRVARMSS